MLSTILILKVACVTMVSTAAVVGCIYLVSPMIQPQAQVVAVPVGGGGGVQVTERKPVWLEPMIG